MKADPDEMIENPDEGLQVPEEYLEVLTESPTTKPEVSAPTQAEMEKFYFTTANTNKACFAEHGTPVLLTISCCPVAKSQFASY